MQHYFVFVVLKARVKLTECVSQCHSCRSQCCQSLSNPQMHCKVTWVELKTKSGFLEVTYSIGTCHFQGMK